MSMLARLPTTGGAAEKLYVDDVFSTYLYTGNGSTQTITNGIDLAGKGGLVWIKGRNSESDHAFVDTERGGSNSLASSTTAPQRTDGAYGVAFNSNGFDSTGVNLNISGRAQASWTFRKAPKFFDVVTWSGTGGGRSISHSLGVAPGFIIVKTTNLANSWQTWHRSLADNNLMSLNSQGNVSINANAFAANSSQTSTFFTVGDFLNSTQDGGYQYVAYLFAHDTTTDGVIQCGSYTGGSGTIDINLGWEPQFVLKKCSSSAQNWIMCDTMRGMPYGANATASLFPNLATAEATPNNDGYLFPRATGFSDANSSTGFTYIYLAIRRPNKPPTTGMQVYNAIARTGTGAAATVTGVGFAPDLCITRSRVYYGASFWDRLRGATNRLFSFATSAEEAQVNGVTAYGNDGITLGVDTVGTCNTDTWTFINHFFKRAPGVFDVVCYTGTGSARTVAHNLGVAPELMFVKRRNSTGDWEVYHGNPASAYRMYLNSTALTAHESSLFNDTAATASVFTVGTAASTNASGGTFVAYLFATKSGISKVGEYSGSGTSNVVVDCGFSTGARFVLIRENSSSGNWYVWDTVRGLTSSADPYLMLNSTSAEVAGNDWIDPNSSGFEVTNNDLTINRSGRTYLYLAFA